MASEKREERSLMEKLKHNYRLVVMNNDTFEEVGSYQLSLLNVYITICVVVVLVTLLVGSIIFFTPIKRYIPGYGDVKEHEELRRLNTELDDLTAKFEAQQAYNDNIRRILVGDVLETAEEVEGKVENFIDSTVAINPIKEDELLRKEIELDEQLQARKLMAKTANFLPQDVPLEQVYFIPPVSGVIGAHYSIQNRHYGTDILAPKNTPVKAAMDGFVFVSDWTLETGNTLGIQHSNNLITFYKHNSALLKKVGDFVKSGEAVAIIGNTGELSDGPHLHFEIWHNGKAVDPSDYVTFD